MDKLPQDNGSQGKGRRKFLIKSSAGIAAGTLFTILPTKSVWATGLGNSLTASGHGSDFSGGVHLRLEDADYFLTQGVHELNSRFHTIFGQLAFDTTGNLDISVTVFDILTNANGEAGPSNINLNMVLVYLNAVHHNNSTIVYPILDTSAMNNQRGLFRSAMSLADHLAEEARTDFHNTASALASVIANPNV